MRGAMWGVVLGGLVFASAVHADSLIGGKEALTTLGDFQRHFSKQPYSVLILDRRERQPIHLEPIDAVLFSPGKGSFEKIRSRDRNHRLLLNSAGGRAGETLTPELLQRLLGLIKSNHMVPYILKDENGQERLVVFTDPYNNCTAHQTSKGISVSVHADPFGRPKTLEENPIWIRKY